MAQHQLGANTIVEEDQNGETVLKNTNTGNSVTLSSIVELTQALGSDATPVPGTSHFEALNAGSLSINGNVYTAADDSELTDVLGQVTNGDIVILGHSEFSTDRTFSTRLSFSGVSDVGIEGATIDASWTFEKQYSGLSNVFVRGAGSLTFNADNCHLYESSGGTTPNVNVNGNSAKLNSLFRFSINFDSGTSGGIVDSSTDVSVTDDGTNTVGDIA